MKNIIITSIIIFCAVSMNAQVLSNKSIAADISNSNAMLDGSSQFSAEAGINNNVGKGIVIPSVDLTTFQFLISFADGVTFPTYFDGMIVYNRATGKTLTAGHRSSTATNVTPGFYYFSNPDGAATESVTSGVWKPLGGGASAAPWNVTGTTTAATGNSDNIYQSGKVGIGASYSSGSVTSTFEVDGSATNKASYNAGTDVAIDFTKSNLAHSASTDADPTFNCTGAKDGGTYTLAWQAGTGTATITVTGLTTKMMNNPVKTDSQHAVYTIVCIGTTAYVYVTLF